MHRETKREGTKKETITITIDHNDIRQFLNNKGYDIPPDAEIVVPSLSGWSDISDNPIKVLYTKVTTD